MAERRFMSNPSPAYRAAVSVLHQLADAEGVDAANRAYAEVAAERIEDLYASKHGLRLSQGHPCFGRVVRPGYKGCHSSEMCSDNPRYIPCSVPGRDHVSLWLKNGRPYSYVFQPYSLDKATLRQLVQQCDDYNMELSINGNSSWHFPGDTIFVEITRSRGE